MNKKKVFITGALRTPIGKVGRSLKGVPAVDLSAIVIRELLKQTNLDKSLIGEVILGNAVSAGMGQNPARQSLYASELSLNIPAFTVNKVCGSGLKAVTLGVQAVLLGDADVVIAGGTENVSQCPDLVPRSGEGTKSSLIHDGLWCALNDTHMGTIADYTAEKYGISRKEQDEYAFLSQTKAAQAQDKKFFESEIVPVKLPDGQIFSVDENIRRNSSIERLLKLPPAFSPQGTVTAGNSPAPADGAAVLLLMSEEAVKKTGAKPIAEVLAYASAAAEPKLVFTSAALAAEKCLKKASLGLKDVGLFEIGEAFAVQAVLTRRLTGLNEKRMNIFGGTIALGHPLGASGARSLVTLLNALKLEKKEIGVVSTCLGGGCAVASVVRMV